MRVILISGKAQHGKDTTAAIMKEQLVQSGNKVLITHFGDLVKHIARTWFDWNGGKDEKGRHILQYVGTDIVRAKKPTFWAEFILQMIAFFGKDWDYIIIPDTRFPNEISTLRDYGANVTHLRVVRDNFTSPLTDEAQKHISENALDGEIPDYYIHNDGNKSELSDKINKWIKENLYGNE